MSKLITSSLTWRFCVAVAAWLRSSWVGRAAACMGRLWRQSATYCFFARLLCSPGKVESSGYKRISDQINLSLRKAGGLMQESFFVGLCYRFYEKIRESFLLGKIFSRGFTAILLFIAAAYAPIDYLLRDVLCLTAVASVWDELLILVCFVWVFLRRMDGDKRLTSRANSVDLFLAFYLLAGLILLYYTVSWLDVNITGFRASMQYILLFFVIVRLIRDERDFMMMYRVMIFIAFAIALHGIWQFIIGVDIPEHWTDQAEDSVRTRVFSIFSNPNIMGAYMLLFAPMSIGMAYHCENIGEKLFYWFCGICMCLGCLFTMSRGAWMALAVAAILFSLIIDRKLFVLMMTGAVLACFLPFVRSRIGYLFTDAFAESNQRGGRAMRWATAFGYLDQENAWKLGLGYGIFGGAVAMQNQVSYYNYMYVDNYYVKTLAENGIVGLSCLLVALSGLLYNGAKACALTARSSYKPLCAGMLAGLVGILVQSFFESLWEEPYMMAL
ncbi:MAG: O-antigen ligase family protein, partial [Oscillospiraceae bacterium]|nr:O-antigen ligase family protein [Oscillospiraceae bacterium]